MDDIIRARVNEILHEKIAMGAGRCPNGTRKRCATRRAGHRRRGGDDGGDEGGYTPGMLSIRMPSMSGYEGGARCPPGKRKVCSVPRPKKSKSCPVKPRKRRAAHSRRTKGGILLGGDYDGDFYGSALTEKEEKKLVKYMGKLDKEYEELKGIKSELKNELKEIKRATKQISSAPVQLRPVRPRTNLTMYRGLKFKPCRKDKEDPTYCPEGIRPYRPRTGAPTPKQLAAREQFEINSAAVRDLMDESRDANGKPKMSRKAAWAFLKSEGAGYMY